jgi:hypothetical protein
MRQVVRQIIHLNCFPHLKQYNVWLPQHDNTSLPAALRPVCVRPTVLSDTHWANAIRKLSMRRRFSLLPPPKPSDRGSAGSNPVLDLLAEVNS